MRELNEDEQDLMVTLKVLEDGITQEQLAERMGWDKQRLIDVCCNVARDFTSFNRLNTLKMSIMLISKDPDLKRDYFTQPLVNCALLMESKLVELNSREKFKCNEHQVFLKQWKKHRGY